LQVLRPFCEVCELEMSAAKQSSLGTMPRQFQLADDPGDAEVSALLALADASIEDARQRSVIARLARAALRAKFPAGVRNLRTLRTASGLSLHVDVADSFAAAAFCGHLQEAEDYAAFMRMVEAGDVVVDVGANFGLYAVQAAQYAGPNGLVMAYEPSPNVLELLQRNVLANAEGAAPIEVRAAGVGASAGRVDFYVAADSAFSGFSRTGRSEISSVQQVEVVPLDDEAALAERAVALLKIDVEGAEGDVLLGARHVLARSHDLIIQFEYSHKNLSDASYGRLEEAVAMARGLGFALFEVNTERVLVELQSAPPLKQRFSGNLYMARPGRPTQRLKNAWASALGPKMALSPEAAVMLRELTISCDLAEQVASFDAMLAEVFAATFEAAPEGIDRVGQVRALQSALLKERSSAAGALAVAAGIQNLERDIVTLRGDVTRWREAHDRVQARLTGVEEGRHQLEDQLRAAASQVQRISGERDAQVQSTADMRAAYDVVHARLVQSNVDKEQVENQLRAAAAELQRVRNERDAQVQAVADARADTEALQAKLSKAIAEIAELNAQKMEDSVGAGHVEGYARRLELALKETQARLGLFAFILPADARNIRPK
jgi:FkbM family methyltransferase